MICIGIIKIIWSTRLVILFKNLAFKIPIDKRGWLQGKNEKDVWDIYKHSHFLAPLRWEWFGIVCQERCEPIKAIDENIVKKVKWYIPRFNIPNCDLYNPLNWGIYEGRQVLLDYGIDERISKMYNKDE